MANESYVAQRISFFQRQSQSYRDYGRRASLCLTLASASTDVGMLLRGISNKHNRHIESLRRAQFKYTLGIPVGVPGGVADNLVIGSVVKDGEMHAGHIEQEANQLSLTPGAPTLIHLDLPFDIAVDGLKDVEVRGVCLRLRPATIFHYKSRQRAWLELL